MTADETYMQEALREARLAAEAGEVPIGAVIVRDGRVIGRGRNMTEALKDPTAHAEMMAVRDALRTTGSSLYRLGGCSMYVTLEPCAMCAGAIVLCRLKRLVIGAMDPKSGACGSLRNVVGDERLNHRAELTTGVLQEECGALLRDFFKALRNKDDN